MQGRYWRELEERRRQREQAEEDLWPFFFGVSDPSHDLRSLYCSTCWREGTHFEEHYAPLRDVLGHAGDIVGEHPALAGIGRRDDRWHEFGALFLNRGVSTSRLSMVAGLMFRATEIGKNGFAVASRELETLLDLSLGGSVDAIPGELDLGYHLSVFCGLRFDERLGIAEDMAVFPIQHVDAFVEKSGLLSVAPGLVVSNDWRPVAAIAKPFRWKPVLFALDDKQPEVNWSEPPFSDATPFFDDARDFIELLAVTHGAPVLYLKDLALCTDRRASLLFGQPFYHSGAGGKSWASPPHRLMKARSPDLEAVEQAARFCWGADSDRHRNYGPVTSRLAQALARSGRYELEDKILDVAIALEQMYEPEGPELNFRLRTRAACFLETDTRRRKKVFRDMGRFYDVRSGIVHRRTGKGRVARKQVDDGSVTDERRNAFEMGFELARRTLVKLLRDGPPEDWNDIVLEQRPAEPFPNGA
ncbi:MAG: HEPN domain-containing protein [Deltaproteobacteria bacterium]|nr:HEPN domain-containing protein [Deltaproteobacteria bacterium]